MGAILEKALPSAQENPALIGLIKESALFAVGAFKAGRTMEETYEDTHAISPRLMYTIVPRPAAK